MSTQQPPTPKASRNSKRSQKKQNSAPSAEPRGALLTTPPSSPPVSSSPGVAFATDGAMFNGDVNGNASSRKKNGTRSTKKTKENSRPNNITQNSTSNHRHTSSQPSIASPPPLKDSPHYAGPTFHASPAPSALPMPSFFSKSVPDSGLATALELDSEADAETETEPELDMTPSKPKAAVAHSNHEPSPLDFLFKAAIDARSKAQQSPEVTKSRTPNTDSKAYQRPHSSANGIFSLELDEPERNMMPIGPAFATPYKDRMNALRPSGVHSQSTGDLNDAHRRMKTEELKNLLLNPKPQRPASASPQPLEAHRGTVHGANMNYDSPLQTSSGPPTPMSAYTQRDARFANVGKINYHSAYANGTAIPPRNASSALRQEFSPDAKPVNAGRMPHGPYFQPPYQGFSIPQQRHNQPPPQGTNFHPSQSQPGGLDTKKMEDDLKRVLKLDLSSNIQPNGMQSSLA